MALSKKRVRGFEDTRSGTSSRTDPTGRIGTTGDSTRQPLYPNQVHETSMSDLLKQLAGQGDLQQLLASLGIQGMGNMSPSQQEDWNKQLLDQLLAVQLEQDKRQYNEGIRDEQRIYDTPTNQLARLMGAGISRDAAIQLLGGSGSGSGSMVTGDAAELAQGLPASQSRVNEMQNQLGIANTVFGAIGAVAGAIGSLGSFGISAASLSTNLAATRAATAGQLLHNANFSKTLAGIENASMIVGVLSQALDAGVLSKNHQFSSSQDMLNYIQENADKFEPFGNLVKTGALVNAAKDIYSLTALNGAYDNWRKSRDYGIDRDYIVANQALDQLYKSVNIDKVNSDIALNAQKIAESIASVINSTDLKNSTVALQRAQTKVAYQQAANLDMQTAVLNQDWIRNQYDLDWLDVSIEDINATRTIQVAFDAAKWKKLDNDPVAKREEIESWLADRKNLRSAIALESYYYANKLSAAELQQAGKDAPIGSDQNLAYWAVYMHNLFDTNLGNPSNKLSREQGAMLGDLKDSAVAAWALLKYVK